MDKNNYWINTLGKPRILLTLQTTEPDYKFGVMFGVKQCNKATYLLFKYLYINLLAEDKFKWLLNSKKALMRVSFVVASIVLLLTLILAEILMM